MTTSSANEYLDKITSELEGGELGKPDCWVVYKTVGLTDTPTGQPMAVYSRRESLYRNFKRLTEETDERYGITVGAWWFDD